MVVCDNLGALIPGDMSDLRLFVISELDPRGCLIFVSLKDWSFA